MAETIMPAAEVASVEFLEEKESYECSFHVLPTVAEGEVAGVFESFKAQITKTGGEITNEEVPVRIALAYEIEKSIEGTNRKFHSAYFGWVRFKLESGKIEHLVEEINHRSDILRTLFIRLTREEELNPFRFHETRKAEKRHVVVEDKEMLTEATAELQGEQKEVSVEELEESLERITEDDDVAQIDTAVPETPSEAVTEDKPAEEEVTKKEVAPDETPADETKTEESK